MFESMQRETHEQWLVDGEETEGVRIDMAPVMDDAGAIQFLTCSAIDLTEQWEAERDLELCRESADAEATQNIAQTVDLVWSAVSSLVHLAETLDENASMHLKRLSESCRVVATVLSFNSVYSQSLDYDFIHMLQQACLLHDIREKPACPTASCSNPANSRAKSLRKSRSTPPMPWKRSCKRFRI
ncbi:MAG: hypothetical protein R2912_02170 [Eubacteriales bacterium]